MDIDITRFFRSAQPAEFSASVAERGVNAGKETWANALAEAATAPLLTTEPQLDALRSWARATGAWDDAQVAALTPAECNALFIQLVAGDLREGGFDGGGSDWDAYRVRAEAGEISGNLYPGADGAVFYTLES